MHKYLSIPKGPVTHNRICAKQLSVQSQIFMMRCRNAMLYIGTVSCISTLLYLVKLTSRQCVNELIGGFQWQCRKVYSYLCIWLYLSWPYRTEYSYNPLTHFSSLASLSARVSSSRLRQWSPSLEGASSLVADLQEEAVEGTSSVSARVGGDWSGVSAVSWGWDGLVNI